MPSCPTFLEEIVMSATQKQQMRLWRQSLLALVLLAASGVTTSAIGQSVEPVDALEGLDPVLLVQGKEVQGELKITLTRGRFNYFFANEGNKAVFEKDPARYEIQLAGYCARMGAPVTGNPDLYTVHQGRIYIFGSGSCKEQFTAKPENYLEPAPAKLTATAEAVKQGQALIEKAVAAMGGVARVDGLTTYQEKSSFQQRRQQGEVEVKTTMTIHLPNRIHIEMQMPEYRDPSVIGKQVIVITPGDAFVIAPRRVIPLRAADRAQREQELQLTPLALLRARKGANFTAAHTGAAKVGATALEQVAIERAGTIYTLGIDPATGRVLSLAYRRRGPQGDFGQLTEIFSDFRAAGGLTLPFKVTATFNGQPWPERSPVIETITINAVVDAALFEKPKLTQ